MKFNYKILFGPFGPYPMIEQNFDDKDKAKERLDEVAAEYAKVEIQVSVTMSYEEANKINLSWSER